MKIMKKGHKNVLFKDTVYFFIISYRAGSRLMEHEFWTLGKLELRRTINLSQWKTHKYY